MTVPAVVNFASESGSVNLRNVEIPDYGPGDVLLKVEAASVCGSDLHAGTWLTGYTDDLHQYLMHYLPKHGVK